MLIQKKLKNLFDNYIVGFPENNMSQARFVANILENKIVTEYDINGAKSEILITYDPFGGQFEIKKMDGGRMSVHVTVAKREDHNDNAEQMVKKLYGTLATTTDAVVEEVKESGAPVPEINPEPIEVESAK